MNELTINPSEYGIEVSKANELVGNLPQIKQERSLLECQYEEVVKMDIEDLNTSKTARALRLKIKENRTKGIEVWHKTTKDYFLKGGQFVDAIKRKEIAVNQRMEENLEEIEKYAENKEAERKELLRIERTENLEQYKDYVPFGINLGEISEDEFTKVFNGAKLQFEAEAERLRKAEEERLRLEAEAKAEEERLAKEREAERLRIEAENKRLSEEKAKLEAEAEKARKEAEAKLEAERLEAEKKLAEERKIQEEKLAKERAERAKIEAELEAKRKAEVEVERLKIEAEKLAKIEAEKARKEAEKLAKAPVKMKMQVWINSFELPTIDESNESIEEIKSKFEAFKKWALTQADLF